MTLTVRVESDSEFWAGARELGRKLDHKELIQSENSISVESLDELLFFFTPQRIRIFRACRGKRFTIPDLAEELGLDCALVKKDVEALADLEVLRIRKEATPDLGTIDIVEPVADKLDVHISL